MIWLVFLVATTAMIAQIHVPSDRWPWEDRRADKLRRAVLIAMYDSPNVVIHSFTDEDGFQLSENDTLFAQKWGHVMPCPENAVTAHLSCSSDMATSIVVTNDGDSIGIYGMSVDRATGILQTSGRVSIQEAECEGKPVVVSSQDGTHLAVICRNDDDPSTVILLSDKLSVDGVIRTVTLPTCDTRVLLRPIYQWVGDTLNIVTVEARETYELVNARFWSTSGEVLRHQVDLPDVGLASIEDMRCELINNERDTAILIMNVRNSPESVALALYRFALKSLKGAVRVHELPPDQRTQYAWTRSVARGSDVFVGLERLSTLYKKQMATNESVSIYTVGDGSVVAFSEKGSVWRVPLMRGTSTEESRTCETSNFGLIQAPIFIADSHLVIVNYREDADRMITAIVLDRNNGAVTKQVPLASMHENVYVFLDQWLVDTGRRFVWGPFGDEVRLMRY